MALAALCICANQEGAIALAKLYSPLTDLAPKSFLFVDQSRRPAVFTGAHIFPSNDLDTMSGRGLSVFYPGRVQVRNCWHTHGSEVSFLRDRTMDTSFRGFLLARALLVSITYIHQGFSSRLVLADAVF